MIKTWRYEQNFNLKERLLGKLFFESGAIIVSENKSVLTAQVEDAGDTLKVSLNYEKGQGLTADCDCSAAKFCEHIWGTLLKAEKENLLQIAGTPPYGFKYNPQKALDQNERSWVEYQSKELRRLYADLPEEISFSVAEKLYSREIDREEANKIIAKHSTVFQEKEKLNKIEEMQETLKAFFSLFTVCTKLQHLSSNRKFFEEYFDVDKTLYDFLPEDFHDKLSIETRYEGEETFIEDLEVEDFANKAVTALIDGAWQDLDFKSLKDFDIILDAVWDKSAGRYNLKMTLKSGNCVFENSDIIYMYDKFFIHGRTCYGVPLNPWSILYYYLREKLFFFISEEEIKQFYKNIKTTFSKNTSFYINGEECTLGCALFEAYPRNKLVAISSAIDGKMDFIPYVLYGTFGVGCINPPHPIKDYEHNVLISRDVCWEMDELLKVFQLPYVEVGYSITFEKEYLLHFLNNMEQLGWSFKLHGRFIEIPTKSELSWKSGIDWFELSGTLEYKDVKLSLKDIIRLKKGSQPYIELAEERYAFVPGDFRENINTLMNLGKVMKDGSLRFTQNQSVLIDALLLSSKKRELSDKQKIFKENWFLLGKKGVQAPPKSFNGELRTYQKQGLKWLNKLKHSELAGILADDMGLGKTIQVLAMLEQERLDKSVTSPSIVISPASLIHNWKNEAAKFTPKLKVLLHYGTARSSDPGSFEDYDLIITTYGVIRADIHKLTACQFNYCILDEAQAVKNPGTASSKAIRLLKAHHRLCLTGTPVENHLGDLWSQIDFLNPGLLGTSSAFKKLCRRLENEPGSLKAFSKALSPLILRRTKKKVLKELPDKIEQVIYCEMKPLQKSLYNELLKSYTTGILEELKDEDAVNSNRFEILEALTRLRQVACHTGLVGELNKENLQESIKIKTLIPLIRESLEEGNKCLVFSQFTSFLAKVKDELDNEKITFEYLDGQTPAKKRAVKVKKFQKEEECGVFLISLKAGGTGLNLTAAQTVFILDPWWNPAVEAQAIDRAHRMGQKKTVLAYRLVSCDTVEERILELQSKKKELADAVLSGGKGLAKLNLQDLNYIFGLS